MRDIIEWFKGLVSYRQLKRCGVELKVFIWKQVGEHLEFSISGVMKNTPEGSLTQDSASHASYDMV